MTGKVFLDSDACRVMNDLHCQTLRVRQGSVVIAVPFGRIAFSFQNRLFLLKLRGTVDLCLYNSINKNE